jgi:hypothetical protein
MNRPILKGRALGYSEILRVIGRYMDRHKLGEVRLIESSDGLILQGVVQAGERLGERETYHLTADDIIDLHLNATAQRGRLM